MKILWFANSYAFQKDVWDKWYEDALICNFLCFSKGCIGYMILKYFDLQFLMLFKRMYMLNDMKILRFTISYAFEKDVWDKWYENTLVCNFLCFWKGCMG